MTAGTTAGAPCCGAGRRTAGLALAALAVAGCSAAPVDDGQSPAAHAGSYPVATPGPQVGGTPEADDRHYQLVAAGDAVRARVGAASVLTRVSGPELTVPPGPPADAAPGVLTVDLRSEAGTLTVAAGSFLVLDEARHAVPVRADVASVAVSPGAPAVLRLSGRLPAGHATLTWRPTGSPLVTWDFVVEID